MLEKMIKYKAPLDFNETLEIGLLSMMKYKIYKF